MGVGGLVGIREVEGEGDSSVKLIESRVCTPVDYADASAMNLLGTVKAQFVWPGPDSPFDEKLKPQAFDICISVLAKPNPDLQRPRFFINGRRIGAVASMRSFTALTERRWTVWAHPQVHYLLNKSLQILY